MSGFASRKRVSFSSGVAPSGCTRRVSHTRPTLVSPPLERDEPDPVAPAREVVRGEAPRREDGTLERVGRVRVPRPRRRPCPSRPGSAPRSPTSGATRSASRPPRFRASIACRPVASTTHLQRTRHARPVGLLDDERVPGVAVQRDVDDLRGPPDLGPFLRREREDVLVELLPVELERGRARELRRARSPRLPSGTRPSRCGTSSGRPASGAARARGGRRASARASGSRPRSRRSTRRPSSRTPRSSRRRGPSASGMRRRSRTAVAAPAIAPPITTTSYEIRRLETESRSRSEVTGNPGPRPR